ncbi:MAG: sugar transferase [Sphingomonadales bacterium]|nr:MAG: sugar transferase [Sphingomonadales bacterium]
MNRALDILLALAVAIVVAIPALLVALAVKLTSRGPVLYWSTRVGRDNVNFQMPKFRTMRVGTPQVATHLLTNASSALTPIGGFLRKTSLDEVPQLWSILCGDMGFVGPRPALFNQDDLIALRTDAGVHRLKPGVTGWAQVNGRDSLSIPDKVAAEAEYLKRRSLGMDLRIMVMTASKLIGDKTVSH